LIYISGNVYAIAYRGKNNDGFLKTVSIAANGDIAARESIRWNLTLPAATNVDN